VKDQKLFKASKAQTAVELAVFGAILIFVLGVLIRYATNFNFVQNQSLEAMRIAFRESFLAGQAESASRNSASILFIEDRKEAENTKYGSLSRTPYIVSGNGIFTQNLYLATDWGHTENLPVMDVFINGRHFTFTTAGFKSVLLSRAATAGALTGCKGNTVVRCLPNDNDSSVWTPGPVECVAQEPQYAGLPDPRNPYIFRWLERGDCPSAGSGNDQPCATILTKIDNGNKAKFCSRTDDPICNDRFDLNRDGVPDVAADAATRLAFAWQWYRIPATNQFINLRDGLNVSVDIDGDMKEEQIIQMEDRHCCTYKAYEATCPDMDKDEDKYKRKAPITKVYVIDSQEGDLDLTYNTVDQNRYNLPAPGLKDNPKMLTIMRKPATGEKGGTRLEVMEGRLYGTGQFARQTQKQDRIDIIERKMQLSNDTGRFIPGPSSPNPDVEVACLTDAVGRTENIKGFITETKDYVSCCSNSQNIYRTCFDKTSRMLYVRSAIQDKRGRRWITDIEEAQK